MYYPLSYAVNDLRFHSVLFVLLIDYETSTPLKNRESMHPFPSSESPIVEKTFTEIDADLTTPELPLSQRYADCAYKF